MYRQWYYFYVCFNASQIIGEFAAAKCSDPDCTVTSLYHHAANQNYSGVWDWSLLGGDGQDDETDVIQGEVTALALWCLQDACSEQK